MRERDTSPATKYICETFAPEDACLQRIREALRADDKEGINVGPSEGKLLQVLLHLVGAKKVLEVGTLYGYSTLWMARALPENGQLISLEASPAHARRARELLDASEVAHRIEIIEGDARQSINKIEGPFDVAFIDANKDAYEDYLNWAERHVRKGGLIIGDNTFLWGEVYSEPPTNEKSSPSLVAMRNFNRRLADKTKYHSILIPTAEGLTVAQKIF